MGCCWRQIQFLSRYVRGENAYLGDGVCGEDYEVPFWQSAKNCGAVNVVRGMNQTLWHLELVEKDRRGWTWM